LTKPVPTKIHRPKRAPLPTKLNFKDIKANPLIVLPPGECLGIMARAKIILA
jgi:hypothetical protein